MSLRSNKITWLLAALLVLASSAFNGCREDDEDQVEVLTPPPTGPGTPPPPSPYAFDIPKHLAAFSYNIPADNPTTVEGVMLGKRLFFERRLSINNQLSCGGCHRPEAAFADPGMAVSLGAQGQQGERNAMAIFNVLWSQKPTLGFNWNRSATTLEEQAFDPVTHPLEMMETWPNVVNKLQNTPGYPQMFERAFGTATIDSNLVVKAIAQFERTLISANSKMDNYMLAVLNDTSQNPPTLNDYLTPQEARGFNVYVSTAKGDCFHCHGNVNLNNPLWTDFDFRNNGLDVNPDSGLASTTKNPADLGKFKTPSLRNLVFTAPYMHDGRFQTLEEVVEFYSTGVKDTPFTDPLMADRGTLNANLTTQEKADLVAFLKTITDSTFVNNPAFRP